MGDETEFNLKIKTRDILLENSIQELIPGSTENFSENERESMSRLTKYSGG